MSDRPIERIMVGLDGSEGSTAALLWAIRLAEALSAEVLAIYAYQPPEPALAPEVGGVPAGLGSEEVAVQLSLRDAEERVFETEWCAPLLRAGVRHRRIFVEGLPSEVLPEIAASERADVFVTGRRGHRGLAGLVLGSVSQHLARHAHVPVVVVPHPEEH